MKTSFRFLLSAAVLALLAGVIVFHRHHQPLSPPSAEVPVHEETKSVAAPNERGAVGGSESSRLPEPAAASALVQRPPVFGEFDRWVKAAVEAGGDLDAGERARGVELARGGSLRWRS